MAEPPSSLVMNHTTQFLVFGLVVVTLVLAPLPFALAAEPASDAKTFDDHLVQANILFKQGKLDEALAAAEAAKKLDAKRFEARASAALILHASPCSACSRI